MKLEELKGRIVSLEDFKEREEEASGIEQDLHNLTVVASQQLEESTKAASCPSEATLLIIDDHSVDR